VSVVETDALRMMTHFYNLLFSQITLRSKSTMYDLLYVQFQLLALQSHWNFFQRMFLESTFSYITVINNKHFHCLIVKASLKLCLAMCMCVTFSINYLPY
jgi:hypothetical protein